MAFPKIKSIDPRILKVGDTIYLGNDRLWFVSQIEFLGKWAILTPEKSRESLALPLDKTVFIIG